MKRLYRAAHLIEATHLKAHRTAASLLNINPNDAQAARNLRRALDGR